MGGGNSAVEEGLFLTKFAKKVTLLVRGDKLSASKTASEKALTTPALDVRFNTRVRREFRGNRKLQVILTENSKTKEVQEMHPSGAFIFIGQKPNTEIFRDFLELDEYGYIKTGHELLHIKNLSFYSDEWLKRHPFDMETCRPGIFAGGDIQGGGNESNCRRDRRRGKAAIWIPHRI